MPTPPLYTTETWYDKPLYTCPCGYQTFHLTKIDAHCAMPHTAPSLDDATSAPSVALPGPASTRRRGVRTQDEEG